MIVTRAQDWQAGSSASVSVQVKRVCDSEAALDRSVLEGYMIGSG
jgi:hypothetical protein